MITARICDPASKHEFMEFIHGTTCIVAVPHGAPSQLRVNCDSTCLLIIEASGKEIYRQEVLPPTASISISELKQPLKRQGIGISDIFTFGPFRNRQAEEPCQRLYNFRAVLYGKEGAEPLATFDFHVLCEQDFHWARAYHLELKNAGSAGSVTQRAEGSCEFCQEARKRLERNWRFEL